MKRYCKGVDITDTGFIEAAVRACLAKRAKRMRPDTVRLFASILGVSRSEARRVLDSRDSSYDLAVGAIVEGMRRELSSGMLTLPPIRVRNKIDGHSGKVRKISVQEIRQLLYDHVAVFGLDELHRLMGEHQVSGRKGMGLSYGLKLMHKWVARASGKVYFVKLDIRRYYESVDTGALMEWLSRRVKNDSLMQLVRTLVSTGERGLNIGSYLSHFLANLYLSDVWHAAKQRMGGVRHALFYMDDMTLIGSNRRKLAAAASKVQSMIEAKGLAVKEWQVVRCSRNHPIDVMGVRFCAGSETLRKRIFRRARRSLIRAGRALRGRAKATSCLLYRCASYRGWLLRSDCSHFMRRMCADGIERRIFNQLKQYG